MKLQRMFEAYLHRHRISLQELSEIREVWEKYVRSVKVKMEEENPIIRFEERVGKEWHIKPIILLAERHILIDEELKEFFTKILNEVWERAKGMSFQNQKEFLEMFRDAHVQFTRAFLELDLRVKEMLKEIEMEETRIDAIKDELIRGAFSELLLKWTIFSLILFELAKRGEGRSAREILERGPFENIVISSVFEYFSGFLSKLLGIAKEKGLELMESISLDLKPLFFEKNRARVRELIENAIAISTAYLFYLSTGNEKKAKDVIKSRKIGKIDSFDAALSFRSFFSTEMELEGLIMDLMKIDKDVEEVLDDFCRKGKFGEREKETFKIFAFPLIEKIKGMKFDERKKFLQVFYELYKWGVFEEGIDRKAIELVDRIIEERANWRKKASNEIAFSFFGALEAIINNYELLKELQEMPPQDALLFEQNVQNLHLVLRLKGTIEVMEAVRDEVEERVRKGENGILKKFLGEVRKVLREVDPLLNFSVFSGTIPTKVIEILGEFMEKNREVFYRPGLVIDSCSRLLLSLL